MHFAMVPPVNVQSPIPQTDHGSLEPELVDSYVDR